MPTTESANLIDLKELRRMTTKHSRMDLPSDFFRDHICSIIYREERGLFGFHSKFEKLKDGCRVEAHCRWHFHTR
jgi:hypothetical protein